MAIGNQWGEVIMIEIGSLESANLEMGGICIHTKEISFLNKERSAVSTHKPRHQPPSISIGIPVSLFLDNIRELMTARDLFVLLNKFVKVLDVFIPGKRRLFTKSRFGFATVSRFSDADTLMRKVNGLWVMDQMIVVKEAFGVRTHEIKGRAEPLNASRAQQVSSIATSLSRKFVSTASMQWKSYAAALKENGVADKIHSPGGLHVKEERTQWLYCSLIGTLAEGKAFYLLRRNCGGKLLILTFPSRRDRERALSGEVLALRSWFLWLRPLSNGCKPGVLRDAWIKCSGLPHQLWNYDNLARIGKMWGEVLREDYVLNMMALAFGWVKIRTSALQSISKEVSLLSNGVLFRIYATEESVFNPEQWVLGFLPIHVGPRGPKEQGYPGVQAVFWRRVRVPRQGRRVMASVNMAQEQGSLVVDLGRGFGPISLLKDTHASSVPLKESLGQRPMGLYNVSQGTAPGGLLRLPSTPFMGALHVSSEQLSTSQWVISNLGGQGCHMGDSSAAINLASSSVWRGRGVVLKKRIHGAVVRAAAVALTRGNSKELSHRHQALLQEATAAWDLGKSLGLQATGPDTEVVDKIFGMEVHDSPRRGCRE
ncbi:hypothetical protein Dimus_033484 [Dionaea muscipula]